MLVLLFTASSVRFWISFPFREKDDLLRAEPLRGDDVAQVDGPVSGLDDADRLVPHPATGRRHT
jgi:hypothetical protein